jgi:hypothetical protein
MITTELRRAWNFHREHAGYCTPPGRAMCALGLARAELAMRELDWEGRWDYDPDIVTTTMDDQRERIASGETVYLVAWIENEQGDWLASCGGIEVTSEDDPYMRVMYAELASEALQELNAEQAEEAGVHVEVRP